MLPLRGSTIDIRAEQWKIGKLRLDAMTEQVKIAVDAGINFIDTANVHIEAKSVEQLRDTIASTRLHLSAAELEVLDEASRLPAKYRGWMLRFQDEYRGSPPFKH
ncbi:MAG: hypothetical protein WA807_03075 [Steroidobacteraceae bacterium]